MSDATHDAGGQAPDGGATMPLSMAAIGQEVVLACVHGGQGLVRRLTEMGLRPGVRFRIMAKNHPGPVIVSLKDSRLVLGYGMAHRIYVSPA